MQAHLLNQLLPFWMTRTVDEKYGGFIGEIDGRDRPHEKSDKAIILNARILWTFSSVFEQFHDTKYFDLAYRAFTYVMDHFYDREFGGVYWMLDYLGNPVNTKKQIYAEAFAIYGLSAYYRASKDKLALKKAVDIFGLIEKHAYDPEYGGYFEGFDREWNVSDVSPLSSKEAGAVKTMNTHLHVLEAYAALYRIWKDPGLKKQLRNLMEIFFRKILTHGGRFQLFFDWEWHSKSDIISFGHDIEGSWLLQEAAEALGEEDMIEKAKGNSVKMVEAVMENGFAGDGGLMNEADSGGIIDADKDWWPQAEAIVGLVNAWQNTSDPKFMGKAEEVWRFVRTKMIDPADGEWWSKIYPDGRPDLQSYKAGPWKAPYHNSRSCLEIIRRL